ncbi:MAG: RNA-binding S4 domain-containing protein [Draconibacterium sp.]|nr:RNA-binding S4 domain-containing protein [Draconibacterium sp.]
MTESVRVDKWLWAVRIFKTRSMATEACKKGHVSIGDSTLKPSRMVHIGETVQVRKSPITKSLKILALAEKRMSAKLILNFVEDVTPAEEIELLEMQKNMRWIARDRGAGRPTKKDRRELDDFFEA